MTTTIKTIAMLSPIGNCSDSQMVRDFIKSHNCEIINVDESPNPNQPDVTLRGSEKDLNNLIQELYAN